MKLFRLPSRRSDGAFPSPSHGHAAGRAVPGGERVGSGVHPIAREHPQKVRLYTVRQVTTPADYLRPQRWSWDLLLRPLDEGLRRQIQEKVDNARLVGLRFFWLDGLFSTVSDNFYINFVPLFALAYGASNAAIGLMTAITNLLGTVALFPGAKMLETLGKRKALVVGSGGGIGRLALIVLVLLPFVVRDPALAIAIIIGVSALRSFMGNFGNPAWTSMTADLVPPALRGRYFTARNQIIGIAALLVGPLSGWVVNHGNRIPHSPFAGYQATFLFALLAGLVSTVCFNSIPEPPVEAGAITRHKRGDLRRAIKGNTAFLGFVGSAFIWNLAVQISAPFFNVYMITGLGASATWVGIAAGMSSLSTLIGQPLFGRLIDTKGNLWVQRVSGILIPVLPLLWIFVRAPWEVLLINLLGGFAWAGYNMSNFNLLLELTPKTQRARAVALYQTVVFAGAVIAPALGGYLADLVGFLPVFAISTAGRLVGIVLFFGWVRPRSGHR